MDNKKEYKTTEAQRRANAKWDKTNKGKKSYYSKKSACKNFILKNGKIEDIQQVKSWLDERLKNDKK